MSRAFCASKLITLLESDLVQRHVDSGSIDLTPPSPETGRRELLRRLQMEVSTDLYRVMSITSGLDLNTSSRDVRISFCGPVASEPWCRIYPRSLILCDFIDENPVIWDFTDRSGAVYASFHDEPMHCLCATDVAELVISLIDTDSIPNIEIGSIPSAWPTVGDQEPDTQELADFLARFEPQYWVHDFRGRDDCAFDYWTFNIWRFGSERLWVQERPKGLKQRLDSWWRTIAGHRVRAQPRSEKG